MSECGVIMGVIVIENGDRILRNNDESLWRKVDGTKRSIIKEINKSDLLV